MIDVFADKKHAGSLNYNDLTKEFVFNYSADNPISLTMPYRQKSYLSQYHLHPVFDMYMPEGYLFELLKNLLIKEYGEMNDFVLFRHLSRHIEGFLTYQDAPVAQPKIALETILQSRDDIFSQLVKQFLDHSAVAGVQPKVLASLFDKATLNTREYIIKSFSDPFPHLAENEYFCMRAVEKAGIRTPKFWLSENKKLFIMEKFTYKEEEKYFYGFEEFCALFGYDKEKKYRGSYERIAKALAEISTQKEQDLKDFFVMTVMNYLLKNGDAHLKNFGILYHPDRSKRFLAPAYDVVNTVVYLPHDKPALTLLGKKVWHDKKALISFGMTHCMLSEAEAIRIVKNGVSVIRETIDEVRVYIKSHPDFQLFGEQLIRIWDVSIGENLQRPYKDMHHAIL